MKKRLLIVTILFGVFWGAFFFAFQIGRAKCIPLFSSKCVAQAWDIFGDLILLMWVERWQTLIAGLIAIAAALIGGYFINKQINQTKAIEDDRLNRRHLSARAVSPLALSALIEYLLATGDALQKIYGQAVGGGIPRTAVVPPFPNLPSEILLTFREMIETSESQIGHLFADILSDIQIQRARIHSLILGIPKRSVLKVNVEQYLIDAAIIHAQAASLFDYARRQTDVAPERITWDAVRSSLHQMGIWEEEYDRIFEIIDGREKDGRKPYR